MSKIHKVSQLDIEETARACHENNRIWCEYNNDFSQVSWDKAPENIKESARDGVRFHVSNPNAGAAGSHTNWLKFKIADGWVYGEKKDVVAKTHPLLIPYEELQPSDKIKDAFFHNLVHTLLRDYMQ